MAVLPVMAYAADPNTPLEPKAPVVKQDSAARTSVQTLPKPPAQPAIRTPASFTPQMPLSEAIDILRNCTTPPLSIVVLWRSLDSAGIYRDTPIGIDGLPGLRPGQYLDLLVLSLSAGASDKIGYIVRGGVVTIGVTTVLSAPRQITRIYDVSDLTAPPSNPSFPPMGFGGMYGNQMMGPAGGYGGGLGAGYGTGAPSMPGSTYGGTRTRSGAPRNR